MWPFPSARGRRYYYTITSTKVINLKLGKGWGCGKHPLMSRTCTKTQMGFLLLFLQILGVCWEGGALRCCVSTASFLTSSTPAVPLVCCCLNDVFCDLKIKFFFSVSLFEELAEIVVMCAKWRQKKHIRLISKALNIYSSRGTLFAPILM